MAGPMPKIARRGFVHPSKRLGGLRLSSTLVDSGQRSQVCDARLCPVRFLAKLSMMRRWQFRQACVLVLGLLVALGMSLSVVQASNMAADMAMSGHQMSATGTGNCNGCNDGPGGAKLMVCDATCVAPAAATVPQSPAPLIERPLDRPLSQGPALSGWTTSPNPHPPKFIAHS